MFLRNAGSARLLGDLLFAARLGQRCLCPMDGTGSRAVVGIAEALDVIEQYL